MLKAMKALVMIILSVFFIFLAVQVWSFRGRALTTEKKYHELQAELDQVQRDHEKLQADYEYYLNPANLEKELRARFNYRGTDEKLIVIVPARSSTATSSP